MDLPPVAPAISNANPSSVTQGDKRAAAIKLRLAGAYPPATGPALQKSTPPLSPSIHGADLLELSPKFRAQQRIRSTLIGAKVPGAIDFRPTNSTSLAIHNSPASANAAATSIAASQLFDVIA